MFPRRYGRYDPSQGPDLNRSVADLQSAAWPLRHLGSAVYTGTHSIGTRTFKVFRCARQDFVWVLRYGCLDVSTRGLNTSVALRAYIPSLSNRSSIGVL